ncbi:MAG: PEP-CTERM sorting domain-containing protein [Alphaproteobacteria bacterium]|nr:PEP-CTERM sorting domain-containing protein [Alphaproteobacteria bacterium]
MTILEDTVSKEVEKDTAFIDTLKKRIGTAALAGVLVPLAAAGMPSEAEAGSAFPDRRSHVEGGPTAEGPAFRYNFEVFNDSALYLGEINGINRLVNWELPLFSLNGIDLGSITSPTDWSFEIIDINGVIQATAGAGVLGQQSDIYNNNNGPYGEYAWNWTAGDDPVLNANPGIYGPDENQFETPEFILHWFSLPAEFEGALNPILEQDSLDGFSFLAEADGTNVPYQASWDQQPLTIGDPPSPDPTAVIGAPDNRTTSVPEPGAIALFATGLLGLLGLRRRRKTV